jgi:DNA-binding MarR family transcriptional regulator
MSPGTTLSEYQALAQFRFLIQRYYNNTEKSARSVGLTTQHYRCLLQLRGLPSDEQPTIRNLAERMQIRHHSAVELVDRMEKRGLFRRVRSKLDRRTVLLSVTPRGEKILSHMVRERIAELRVTGPDLVKSLAAVIATSRKARARPGSNGRRLPGRLGAQGKRVLRRRGKG